MSIHALFVSHLLFVMLLSLRNVCLQLVSHLFPCTRMRNSNKAINSESSAFPDSDPEGGQSVFSFPPFKIKFLLSSCRILLMVLNIMS